MRPNKKKRIHNNRNKAKKNLAKRWKKGHSCSSNPQYNDHRQKVGVGYTSSSDKSTLTAAALAKLDASNEQMLVDGSEFDATSIGGNTFKTFATNFTECTNVTFNQIHRLWTSNSALHKEVRSSAFSSMYVNIQGDNGGGGAAAGNNNGGGGGGMGWPVQQDNGDDMSDSDEGMWNGDGGDDDDGDDDEDYEEEGETDEEKDEDEEEDEDDNDDNISVYSSFADNSSVNNSIADNSEEEDEDEVNDDNISVYSNFADNSSVNNSIADNSEDEDEDNDDNISAYSNFADNSIADNSSADNSSAEDSDNILGSSIERYSDDVISDDSLSDDIYFNSYMANDSFDQMPPQNDGNSQNLTNNNGGGGGGMGWPAQQGNGDAMSDSNEGMWYGDGGDDDDDDDEDYKEEGVTDEEEDADEDEDKEETDEEEDKEETDEDEDKEETDEEEDKEETDEEEDKEETDEEEDKEETDEDEDKEETDEDEDKEETDEDEDKEETDEDEDKEETDEDEDKEETDEEKDKEETDEDEDKEETDEDEDKEETDEEKDEDKEETDEDEDKEETDEDKEETDEEKDEDKEETDEEKDEDKEETDEEKDEDKEETDEEKDENKEETDEEKDEDKEETDEEKDEDKEETDEEKDEDKVETDEEKDEDKEKTDEEKDEDEDKEETDEDKEETDEEKDEDKEETDEEKDEDKEETDEEKDEDEEVDNNDNSSAKDSDNILGSSAEGYSDDVISDDSLSDDFYFNSYMANDSFDQMPPQNVDNSQNLTLNSNSGIHSHPETFMSGFNLPNESVTTPDLICHLTQLLFCHSPKRQNSNSALSVCQSQITTPGFSSGDHYQIPGYFCTLAASSALSSIFEHRISIHDWTCSAHLKAKSMQFSQNISQPSDFHMLAVLAAVTEVIKEHGGKESETEYFAALITAMDTLDTEESLTAATYLLSLVINKVPAAVLQKKFSDVSKKLLDLLVKNANSESTSLIKSLLRSLAALLCAQDMTVWEASYTQQIYLGILAFITHNKPKVRKTSHESVQLILKSSALMKSEKAPPYHPMAPLTAKHCIRRIEESGAGTDAIDTLHVLALVKKIFGVLPQNNIQAMCETILKIMTLATPMVVACCMQALYGLVNTAPKLTNLGTKLNAQIITALYDYQPLETDIQPTCAWLSVMEKSVITLCRQDIELGEHHLPKIFTAAMKYLITEHSQLHRSAANCMKVLLKECVANIPEEKLTSAASGSCVQQVVKTLSSGLTYQYHAAWKSVISVLAVMLQVIGKPCQQLMRPALTFLAEMRESQNFTFNAEVDSAIGTAIRSMGPRNILSVIPLKITGDGSDLDFPRSWLMPVLQNHISNTELGFFASYFLPLAKKLEEKSAQFKAEDNMVAAKSYEAVVLQIWSLLPSFCDRPTDVTVSFKAIARILGATLTEKPSLRNSILSALRKIVYTSLDKDDDVKELSRFAKNFLPILFNLLIEYATDSNENPLRVTVFETIKAYVQISDTKILQDYTDTSLNRFNDKESTKGKKAVLLDLCICTVHSASVHQVKKLFKLATRNFQNTDRTLQKKSYRILETICGSDSEACSEFVNQEVLLIQQTLLNSLSSSNLCSKAPRLRCLIHIVKKLKSTETEFLKITIPEAILCTRDIATKARQAAYTLLVEIGKAFVRFENSAADDDDDEDAISEYFKLIFEGLALSPTVISATLLAMTRIMYEFKEIINLSLLDTLLEHCCVLMVSKSREIVKSTLSFLQVLLSSFPDYQLGCHLDRLILTLTAMKEDARHHFRFRTKMIYARLIRKFGFQIIYKKSPDSIKKVLANIQKAEKRKKRKKTQVHDDDDEEEVGEVELSAPAESVEDVLKTIDSDLEDDDSKEQKKKAKSKKSKPGGQAWLQENTDENITDFMDISASRSVTTTKPKASNKTTNKESIFQTSSDGRLLISNEDENHENESSDEDDDLEEVLQSIGAKMKSDQCKKRKREADFKEESNAPEYVAGGHGIHRPIKKHSKSQGFGSEYKSKKAGGDVKQKGKPDPYAYVQLNYQDLNKRKRAKLKGKFNGLVKSAKKGAQRGSKAMKFSRKSKR